jgi:hypothetical protein
MKNVIETVLYVNFALRRDAVWSAPKRIRQMKCFYVMIAVVAMPVLVAYLRNCKKESLIA